MTGQLTLGMMIAVLEKMDPEIPTTLRIRWCSYRGNYSELGAEFELGSPRKLQELLMDLREVEGSTFSGWKGGEYTMFDTTPVWLAPSGISTQIPMTIEAFTEALQK